MNRDARTTHAPPAAGSGAQPDSQSAQRILKARAEALARLPAPAAADECLDVLAFSLAWESYAIESRFVHTVCPVGQLTPVPCTPAFVLGVVSLHGEILSVIDLRTFFELPVQGLTDLNRLIVLDGEGMRFGIMADAVIGVRQLAKAGLQPSLPTLTGIREEYLLGVGADRTAVLDGAKLLTDRKLVVNDTVG